MSTTQRGLFSDPPQTTLRDLLDAAKTPPTDPTVRPDDVPRLISQNSHILARLRDGPATAAELAAISLKYTSRISDLRKAGHDIRLCVQCRADGRKAPDVYALFV